MKFYVATAFDHASAATQMMDALRERGHVITFDWTVYQPLVADGWKPDGEELENIAAEEVEGVRDADALIVLLPGGRGTHAELGVALALRKPVCIFGEETRATPFYLHPAVCFRGSRRSPSEMCLIAETSALAMLRLLAR